MHLFQIILIFKFLLSFTCFEPEGSFSGRWLYIQVWYSVFNMHQYKQSWWKYRTHSSTNKTSYTDCNTLYHTCTYNRLPEDEPSGSKHVEDNRHLKIKILI